MTRAVATYALLICAAGLLLGWLPTLLALAAYALGIGDGMVCQEEAGPVPSTVRWREP